jgi:hypothetical protein
MITLCTYIEYVLLFVLMFPQSIDVHYFKKSASSSPFIINLKWALITHESQLLLSAGTTLYSSN